MVSKDTGGEPLQKPGKSETMVRPRLNTLLVGASKNPLVTVIAGSGCGKTRAVSDFVREQGVSTVWVQLSERDNVHSRFWENFVHAFSLVNRVFAKDLSEMGFPNLEDSLNQWQLLHNRGLSAQPYIFVLDDFHLVENQDVKRFVQQLIMNHSAGSLVILISREPVRLNLSGLQMKGFISHVGEEELNFTEEELSRYLHTQNLSVPTQDLHDIFLDTSGWAFAVNFIARSLGKSPGYSGYVRTAMRKNIFLLMEHEVWDVISERLRRFLVKLSLVDHLSADLVSILAHEDEELLAELRRQSAYVRFDNYINAFLIHHLFLDFLRTKQAMLTESEERETFQMAAAWCNQNGFKLDALSYFEKAGDYPSIVSIFFELPAQVPSDIARFAMHIFDRAPPEIFDQVEGMAMMHVRAVIAMGLWREVFVLLEQYSAKCLALPEDNAFRNRTLGGLYYLWGILSSLMSTTEDRYDFDSYFAKQDECLTRFPLDPGHMANHPVGAWIILIGSARQGAPEEFIDALSKTVRHLSHCFKGAAAGEDDLARGELMYYQGNAREAQPFLVLGLEQARANRQFELENRALFYLLRIAVARGDYEGAEQVKKEIEAQLDEEEYTSRFFTYDIILGWYHNMLDQPERTPSWLKERFSPYGHPSFIENFGNQIKAIYCYNTRNYAPLLAFVDEMKRRESILFNRVELLAMEACVRFKMKNKPAAMEALRATYADASPNGLLMPFICLGKDMRTLASAALREPDINIPQSWLETIKKRSSSFAKNHARFLSGYKTANDIGDGIVLSVREREVLNDMYYGLSRSEIAANRNLSINTVKMVVNSVYEKLDANNLADVIRIVAERKLL